MPTVKTVSVTYGRKFNLGDYNSATIDCTVWADVEPYDNLDETMKSLWSMAKENVKAQSIPLFDKKANVNIRELFLGLPVDIADAEFAGDGFDPSDGLPFGDK